ncbi:MAG: sodium:solute symporter family protein [Armatimonadota bacterium]
MAARIAVVLLFVLINIGIGYWCSRRIKNVGDFFIAGRKVGPWMSAFAFGTTYFSAVLFIGYAGKLGWGYGMNVLWIAAGNVLIGSLAAWLILAKRTRSMTARLDSITMPEFLGSRYAWPTFRSISAVIIFIFLVPYSASVYQGLGYLFEMNLGIDYLTAVILMSVITGVYLLMGGYLAVAITDFFQGIVQICGVTAMIYLVTRPIGGIANSIVQGTLPENAPALAATSPLPGWVTLAALALITSLGVWGMPQMVQKFYSIKRAQDIRPATIISTFFCLLIAGGAYFTGGMSRMLLNPSQLNFNPALEPDKIIPTMLALHTPEWFSVLILLIVLAASMSTLASLVLVSSAAVSVDLLGYRVKGEGADKKGVLVLRLLCGLFVVLSVVMAAYKISFIVNMMAFSWGALAGFFLAPYIYGLFYKKATMAGAVAASFTGLAIAILVPILWRFPLPDGGLIAVAKSPAIPVASAAAMIIPLIVLPLVSSLTRKLPKEHVEHVFGEDEQAAKEGSTAKAVAN